MNNTFSRQRNRLISKVKYYANRLLFPISFIDTFASKQLIYDNINIQDAPKMYKYLNTYNNYILKTRKYLEKLYLINKWGFITNSYILLKIEGKYLTKMINIYENLILKFIDNSKKNQVQDVSQFNFILKNNLFMFMRIYKLNGKYILNDGQYISSVTETYIDSLLISNIVYQYYPNIIHPLYLCDKFTILKNDEVSYIF